MRAMRMATFLVTLAGSWPTHSDAQRIELYSGSCDASAGISLSGDIFVVGNDENNTLHFYRRGKPAPIGTLPLSTFLGTGSNEADIEGAAQIGSRIYWISSHSRSSNGKRQPSRHRIFATEIRGESSPRLEPVGKPYVDLLRDLTDTEALKPYQLDAAARLAGEAPGGLNIEGLAATSEGGLLIGLRNPLRDGRARIVPLHNPAGIIEGERAKLGAPIELDLGRRGIRSIELVGHVYLIVAGPTADSGTFALYRWTGRAADMPTQVTGLTLGTLRPEALFAIPHTSELQLLSDDGGVRIGEAECKQLGMSRQSFRGLTVTLQ